MVSARVILKYQGIILERNNKSPLMDLCEMPFQSSFELECLNITVVNVNL